MRRANSSNVLCALVAAIEKCACRVHKPPFIAHRFFILRPSRCIAYAMADDGDETDSVLILGGGIGGLSTAHVLRQLGYRGSITIVEKNAAIGGDARSAYSASGLPTEHSWRVYFPAYATLAPILKQIPAERPGMTVYDHLTRLDPFISLPEGRAPELFSASSRGGIENYLRATVATLSTDDKVNWLDKIAHVETSSRERIYGELSEVTWNDFVGAKNPIQHDYLVRAIGPFYGTDWKQASASSTIEQLAVLGPHGGLPYAMVMDGPTSDVWFVWWQKWLQQNDVNIRTSTPVTKIDVKDRRIQSVQVNGAETLRAKWYVCSLPAYGAKQLFAQIPARQLSKTTAALQMLGDMMKQNMAGVQIYFGERIALRYPSATLYPVNSPWQLLVEPCGSVWKSDKYYVGKTVNGGQVQDMWTLTICDPHTPGTNGKTMVQCSIDEIKQEVWAQLQAVAPQVDALTVPDTRSFALIAPLHIELWEAYHDIPAQADGSGGGGGVYTTEPKSSPNVGTLKLRPYTETEISNMLFATAYTRGTREMLLMDAAAEAGARAAQVIVNGECAAAGQSECNQWTMPQTTKRWPALLAPLVWLDKKLYQSGLKHASSYVIPGRRKALPFLILYFVVGALIVALVLKRIASRSKR